jgi:hypothetical protein
MENNNIEVNAPLNNAEHISRKTRERNHDDKYISVDPYILGRSIYFRKYIPSYD